MTGSGDMRWQGTHLRQQDFLLGVASLLDRKP